MHSGDATHRANVVFLIGTHKDCLSIDNCFDFAVFAGVIARKLTNRVLVPVWAHDYKSSLQDTLLLDECL